MKDNKVTFADLVIQSVNWAEFEVFDGTAAGFGLVLAEFVSDRSNASRLALWHTVENHVFAQDDIYSSAEPTILVLFAALIDRPTPPVRIAVLDLLFHLVQAASFRNDELGRRCGGQVVEGAWLLLREARSSHPAIAEAALEILEVCAPDVARIAKLTV